MAGQPKALGAQPNTRLVGSEPDWDDVLRGVVYQLFYESEDGVRPM